MEEMMDIAAMIEFDGLAVKFVDVCAEDDLWDGEMESFDVGDNEILLVKVNGQIRAYDGICPHQSVRLVEGELTEDGIIICKAHRWQFDANNGRGVNPAKKCLRRFPVKVADGRIFVGTEPEAAN
jgi:nitrite reductase/ring-hydroxylating ferredoxin subunit